MCHDAHRKPARGRECEQGCRLHLHGKHPDLTSMAFIREWYSIPLDLRNSRTLPPISGPTEGTGTGSGVKNSNFTLSLIPFFVK